MIIYLYIKNINFILTFKYLLRKNIYKYIKYFLYEFILHHYQYYYFLKFFN